MSTVMVCRDTEAGTKKIKRNKVEPSENKSKLKVQEIFHSRKRNVGVREQSVVLCGC